MDENLRILRDNLVFDRTQDDVIYAETLLATGKNIPEDLKGAYNISDRNRVESTLAELARTLKTLGYTLSANYKENYTLTTDPTSSLVTNMRTSIMSMQKILKPEPDWPAIPTNMNALDITKANNLEKLIYLMLNYFERLDGCYAHSGSMDLFMENNSI